MSLPERPQAAETGEMYNFRQKMLAAPAIIKNNTTIENDLTTKSIDYRTATHQLYQNDESMFASRSSSLGGAGGGGGNKSNSRKNISCEILKRK
jgi:hypothetical protein